MNVEIRSPFLYSVFFFEENVQFLKRERSKPSLENERKIPKSLSHFGSSRFVLRVSKLDLSLIFFD